MLDAGLIEQPSLDEKTKQKVILIKNVAYECVDDNPLTLLKEEPPWHSEWP